MLYFSPRQSFLKQVACWNSLLVLCTMCWLCAVGCKYDSQSEPRSVHADFALTIDLSENRESTYIGDANNSITVGASAPNLEWIQQTTNPKWEHCIYTAADDSAESSGNERGPREVTQVYQALEHTNGTALPESPIVFLYAAVAAFVFIVALLILHRQCLGIFALPGVTPKRLEHAIAKDVGFFRNLNDPDLDKAVEHSREVDRLFHQRSQFWIGSNAVLGVPLMLSLSQRELVATIAISSIACVLVVLWQKSVISNHYRMKTMHNALKYRNSWYRRWLEIQKSSRFYSGEVMPFLVPAVFFTFWGTMLLCVIHGQIWP